MRLKRLRSLLKAAMIAALAVVLVVMAFPPQGGGGGEPRLKPLEAMVRAAMLLNQTTRMLEDSLYAIEPSPYTVDQISKLSQDVEKQLQKVMASLSPYGLEGTLLNASRSYLAIAKTARQLAPAAQKTAHAVAATSTLIDLVRLCRLKEAMNLYPEVRRMLVDAESSLVEASKEAAGIVPEHLLSPAHRRVVEEAKRAIADSLQALTLAVKALDTLFNNTRLLEAVCKGNLTREDMASLRMCTSCLKQCCNARGVIGLKITELLSWLSDVQKRSCRGSGQGAASSGGGGGGAGYRQPPSTD